MGRDRDLQMKKSGLKEAGGMEQVQKKSLRLTQYLMDLIQLELTGYGFEIGSPRHESKRGGHIILEHQEAARICKALKQ
jgi:kynureninase